MKENTFHQHLASLPRMQAEAVASRRVLLIGAGVVGSQLAEMLTRLGIGGLVVVDRDGIAGENLYGAFREAQVGQPKAAAVVEACRAIWPEGRFHAVVRDVADLGLGLFAAADVICGGVDSLAARERINDRCFRLGRPYVDAAVGGATGTVRLAHCLACAWSKQDWEEIGRQTPCRPFQPGAPTLTTAYVAAATAALQAQMVVEVLHGRAPWNWEWRIDFGGPVLLKNALPSDNPDCLFDHERLEGPVLEWELPSPATLDRLYHRAVEAVGEGGLTLEFESADVATCWQCGRRHRHERLHYVPASGQVPCPECGRPARPVEWLEAVGPEAGDRWGDSVLELPLGEWIRVSHRRGAVWLAPRDLWEDLS
jgi:hypothetical protein